MPLGEAIGSLRRRLTYSGSNGNNVISQKQPWRYMQLIPVSRRCFIVHLIAFAAFIYMLLPGVNSAGTVPLAGLTAGQETYTVLLKSIAFVNGMSGWAGGDDGTILATRNGGATWSKQKS